MAVSFVVLLALMSSRVWPRAPRSGANKTSNVIDINDSISSARGVDDDDNNNYGRGMATPEH